MSSAAECDARMLRLGSNCVALSREPTVSDLVTAKCVAAAGCIGSLAGLAEHFAWYAPPFVWGFGGALTAYVLDPPDVPLKPIQVLIRAFGSAVFSAAVTAFVVEHCRRS